MKSMTSNLTIEQEISNIFQFLTLYAGENMLVEREDAKKGMSRKGAIAVKRRVIRQNADGEPEEKDVLVERYVFYPSTYYPTRLGSVAIYGGNPVVMCGQMRKRGMLFGHSIMSARVEYGRCCFLDVRFIP